VRPNPARLPVLIRSASSPLGDQQNIVCNFVCAHKPAQVALYGGDGSQYSVRLSARQALWTPRR
jgi:hypothetical protein